MGRAPVVGRHCFRYRRLSVRRENPFIKGSLREREHVAPLVSAVHLSFTPVRSQLQRRVRERHITPSENYSVAKITALWLENDSWTRRVP